MALFPGLPRWAGTRKVKPIWILLKQETVSGSSISWAICESAPRSRQIIMPATHHSVFYRPDALPAAQPTASKHWSNWVTKCIWAASQKQTFLRVLPIILQQKPNGIDMECSYISVTLRIQNNYVIHYQQITFHGYVNSKGSLISSRAGAELIPVSGQSGNESK